MDCEKVVFADKDAVILDWSKENVESLICQAIFDEIVRLRKCTDKKERDSIRNFLTESLRILTSNIPDKRSQEVHQDDMKQSNQ